MLTVLCFVSVREREKNICIYLNGENHNYLDFLVFRQIIHMHGVKNCLKLACIGSHFGVGKINVYLQYICTLIHTASAVKFPHARMLLSWLK